MEDEQKDEEQVEEEKETGIKEKKLCKQTIQ